MHGSWVIQSAVLVSVASVVSYSMEAPQLQHPEGSIAASVSLGTLFYLCAILGYSITAREEKHQSPI